jgi:hypothetical protein
MTIPIIAVGYSRPRCLSRLLTSLLLAEYDGQEVVLIISIDKSGNDEVERVAAEFVWPFGEKRVVLQPQRLGLRKHILQCGGYTSQFESIIVLEDDLYVSPLFHRFARQALATYADDDRIAGISLYSHLWNVNCSRPFVPEEDGTDAYFLQFAQSWGQVWNQRMWNGFLSWYDTNALGGCRGDDIPDRVKAWPESSWLKYHIAYVIRCNKHFVYPRVSLTTNCGEVGQHAARVSAGFQVPLLLGGKRDFVFPRFREGAVAYDAYWERQGLGRHLHIPDNEICVDLYGTKANRAGQRYWLTMERRPHRVLASYGLGMRPHEVGVRLGMPGDDIFLYDTTVAGQTPPRHGESKLSVKKTLYDVRSIRGCDLLLAGLHQCRATIRKRIRRMVRS